MRIVLLSGGSGKRLWPLSNEIRSKLFLKLLPTGNGQLESMIQRVCRQLQTAGLLEHTVIVTHHSQAEITRSHVGPHIPIVEEPHKRGTYTAIALASTYLAKQQAAADEVVCVLPVDLFVEQGFFSLLTRLPDALAGSGADILLVGTEPSYPSSQYGYMVPDQRSALPAASEAAAMKADQEIEEAFWLPIQRFAEKPDPVTAADLIEKGALWNCGVFGFKLGFMLDRLQREGSPDTMEAWTARYSDLREASFDEEAVERSDRRAALRFTGPWHDLGSWDTFVRHMGDTQIGPGHVAAGAANTHLVNELSCPIHVIGLSDVIVAASQDGILVASKSEANRIKDLLGAPSRLPMYEERRWGICRIVDYAEQGQGAVLTRRIEMQPGRHTSYHLHQCKEEVWTVLSGKGCYMLEDEIFTVGPGDVMRFPPCSRHGVKAITGLVCMQVEIGDLLESSDIERLLMSW